MQVTSLLTKKDVAPKAAAPITKWSLFGFNDRPAEDGVVDVHVIHRVNWKLLPATFVLRLAKCVKATEPGMWVPVIAGFIIGLFSLIGTFMDMDIHQQFPPLPSMLFHCGTRVIETIILGWIILYGSWEFIQTWKWLCHWSYRIKHGKDYKDED